MIRLRHVGVVVSDMEKSLHFYTNLLGATVKKDMIEEGEYMDIFLALNNVKVRTVKLSLQCGSGLELLHFFSHLDEAREHNKITQIGCSHVALTVDNLSDVYLRLSQEGVKFNNPPYRAPDGMAKVAFCEDPDGTLLELVEEL